MPSVLHDTAHPKPARPEVMATISMAWLQMRCRGRRLVWPEPPSPLRWSLDPPTRATASLTTGPRVTWNPRLRHWSPLGRCPSTAQCTSCISQDDRGDEANPWHDATYDATCTTPQYKTSHTCVTLQSNTSPSACRGTPPRQARRRLHNTFHACNPS